MEITRLKVNIEDVYISKPLERETFIKVTNEHPSTIHSLYLIANELKAMHYFLELDDHPEYAISAYINVYHGYCDKARQQISVIKPMQDKLKIRPFYKISYSILSKPSMRAVFSFKHMSSNKCEIYKLIEVFYKKTEILCKTNTF